MAVQLQLVFLVAIGITFTFIGSQPPDMINSSQNAEQEQSGESGQKLLGAGLAFRIAIYAVITAAVATPLLILWKRRHKKSN